MIKIISFVDSFKHYEKPIAEFQKRLGKSVVFVKLKPSKRKEVQEIVQEETNILLEYLQKNKNFNILLSIDGTMLGSKEFCGFLEKKKQNNGNICFIIGGAYGVDEEKIKEYIDYKISFSKMTFPHAQAIMMLYEQLYRAESIKVGRNYHH